MTGWSAVWLVATRELGVTVRRKVFWIVIGIVLALSTAAVVLPAVTDSGRPEYAVVVVGGSPALSTQLQEAADSLEVDLRLSTAPTAGAATDRVAGDDADVAVVAGRDPVVLAQAGRAESLVAAAQQILSLDSLVERLGAAGLDRRAVDDALAASAVRVVRLDEDDTSRQASASVVSTALYLLLAILMVQVANGTAIEKANRVSEVLLAIVRPGALLFGKVIGVAIIGLLTLSAAIVPPLVELAAGGDLPPGLPAALVGSGPWLVVGLALYLTIAGALGALVDRQEEVNSVVTPLTIVLVASFFVSQGAADTPLGRVLAIVPLTSPMMMPVRIATGDATVVEMVASLAVGVATVAIVVRVGSAIYSRAIGRTGRRLKLREVLT